MRVNSIAGYSALSSTNKNKTVNFKGSSQVGIANIGSEPDRKHFTSSDFPISMYQTFVSGKLPVESIKESYSPDKLIKGKIYFADNYECLTDWAVDNHSGVIIDYDKLEISPESIDLEYDDYAMSKLEGMLYSIEVDTRYYNSKLEKLSEDETDKKKAYLDKLSFLEEKKAIAAKNYEMLSKKYR